MSKRTEKAVGEIVQGAKLSTDPLADAALLLSGALLILDWDSRASLVSAKLADVIDLVEKLDGSKL